MYYLDLTDQGQWIIKNTNDPKYRQVSGYSKEVAQAQIKELNKTTKEQNERAD